MRKSHLFQVAQKWLCLAASGRSMELVAKSGRGTREPFTCRSGNRSVRRGRIMRSDSDIRRNNLAMPDTGVSMVDFRMNYDGEASDSY